MGVLVGGRALNLLRSPSPVHLLSLSPDGQTLEKGLERGGRGTGGGDALGHRQDRVEE